MKPVDLYTTKFPYDISDKAIRSATIMQGPGNFFGFICTHPVRAIVDDLSSRPAVEIAHDILTSR